MTQVASEDARKGGRNPRGQGPAPGDQPKVLVVDDDHLTLRSLEKTLQYESFQVWTARRMEMARDLFAEIHFDAAMIDLCLEDGYGTELVKELRNATTPCCALVLTGMRRSEAAREAMAAGAEEILSKPVEAERLVGSLHRAVERTRLWRIELNRRAAEPEPLEPEQLGPISEARAAARPLPEPPPGVVSPRNKNRLTGFPPLPTLKLLDAEKTAEALVHLANLTECERKILAPILRGENNAEISALLDISERTVKFHVSNILKKLRVSSRGDLIRFFF